MAAADEIAIKLGIKTGDLKAALADTGSRIQKLKKDGEMGPNEGLLGSFKKMQGAVTNFKNILAGAGLVGLFRSVFNSAVEYAESYTGAVDENVAATLRLRDAQKDLGNLVGKAGTVIAGAMEKVGLYVGGLVYGFDEAGLAAYEMEQASVKAFDDAKVTRMTAAVDRLTKAKRDAAFAEADANRKVEILAADLMKLYAEQAKLKKDSAEFTEKEAEIVSKVAELRRAESAAVKEVGDAQKKAADDERQLLDDRAKAAADRREDMALSKEEELELFLLQRKNSAELTESDRERLKVLTLQKQQKALQYEMDELITKKNREGLNPEEEKRLVTLVQQSTEVDKQLRAIIDAADASAKSGQNGKDQLPVQEAITFEMAEQARLERIKTDEAARQLAIAKSLQVTISRTGKEYGQQSGEALEGVRDRLESQLQTVREQNAMTAARNRNPFQYAIENELAAVERELDQRRSVQNTVARFGEDAARRKFGDTVVDNGLRDMQDATKRTSVAIERIEQRLAGSPFFRP